MLGINQKTQGKAKEEFIQGPQTVSTEQQGVTIGSETGVIYKMLCGGQFWSNQSREHAMSQEKLQRCFCNCVYSQSILISQRYST